MHYFFHLYLYQKRNQERYQGKKFACTLFLVHLPYSINKEIIIHVFYRPCHQHCIICVMNMLQNIYSSLCKDLFLEMHNKGWMHLFRDVLMGHNRKKLLYWIMAYIHAIWYIVESVYLSKLVFKLDTCHWTDHFITVCGKWISDSNLKVVLPLTQVFLNSICCGNDTDENKFIGILHEIITVPHEVFQWRSNIK